MWRWIPRKNCTFYKFPCRRFFCKVVWWIRKEKSVNCGIESWSYLEPVEEQSAICTLVSLFSLCLSKVIRDKIEWNENHPLWSGLLFLQQSQCGSMIGLTMLTWWFSNKMTFFPTVRIQSVSVLGFGVIGKSEHSSHPLCSWLVGSRNQ